MLWIGGDENAREPGELRVRSGQRLKRGLGEDAVGIGRAAPQHGDGSDALVGFAHRFVGQAHERRRRRAGFGSRPSVLQLYDLRLRNAVAKAAPHGVALDTGQRAGDGLRGVRVESRLDTRVIIQQRGRDVV
jgi:hypothetical protein